MFETKVVQKITHFMFCFFFRKSCHLRVRVEKYYRGADKSLARPGMKQANVSVRMAWISFGALPYGGRGLYDSSRLNVVEIARVPYMLPSLFPFWSAKDISAPRYKAGQATDDHMAHSYCVLGKWNYKHTFGICNTYCFSTATIVTRTCLVVTSYTEWPKKMYTLFTHQYLWNKFKWNFYFRVRV